VLVAKLRCYVLILIKRTERLWELDQNISTAAVVSGVLGNHRVAGGAGPSEEVQHNRICITAVLKHPLNQLDRLGLSNTFSSKSSLKSRVPSSVFPPNWWSQKLTGVILRPLIGTSLSQVRIASHQLPNRAAPRFAMN